MSLLVYLYVTLLDSSDSSRSLCPITVGKTAVDHSFAFGIGYWVLCVCALRYIGVGERMRQATRGLFALAFSEGLDGLTILVKSIVHLIIFVFTNSDALSLSFQETTFVASLGVRLLFGSKETNGGRARHLTSDWLGRKG